MIVQLGDLVQKLRDELERSMQSQQITSAVFGGLEEILFSFVRNHRLQIAIVFAQLLVLPVVFEYHKFTVHIGCDERKDFAQIVEETVQEVKREGDRFSFNKSE